MFACFTSSIKLPYHGQNHGRVPKSRRVTFGPASTQITTCLARPSFDPNHETNHGCFSPRPTYSMCTLTRWLRTDRGGGWSPNVASIVQRPPAARAFTAWLGGGGRARVAGERGKAARHGRKSNVKTNFAKTQSNDRPKLCEHLIRILRSAQHADD